jgi:hypothetical protein
MTTTLMPAPASYRGEDGRFLKGNPGGPGNPHIRQVARLKAALYESITPDDVHALMRRMLDEALAGNVAAARLVVEHTLGKPLPGSTASALDAELAEQYSLDLLSSDELHALLALYQKMQRPTRPDDRGEG